MISLLNVSKVTEKSSVIFPGNFNLGGVGLCALIIGKVRKGGCLPIDFP